MEEHCASVTAKDIAAGVRDTIDERELAVQPRRYASTEVECQPHPFPEN